MKKVKEVKEVEKAKTIVLEALEKIKNINQKDRIMMQFVIKALDGAGMLEKRMEVRPRHLEGMKKLNDHIICAGGLLDEEGKMKGSLLVMEFESREEVDQYLAQEPYVLEHVWEKIEVERLNVVIRN